MRLPLEIGDGRRGERVGLDARPTAAEERRFAELDAQLAALRGELRQIFERDLAAFNRAVAAQGVPPVVTAP